MSGDFRDGLLRLPRHALAPRANLGLAPQLYVEPVPVIPRVQPVPNGLREAIRTLQRYWKLIALCALLPLLIAPFILILVPPSYEADALVQVEARDSNASKTVSGEISGISGQVAPVSAEVELLKSRLILGTVIDQMRLDLVAAPRVAPLIGNWMAEQTRTRDWLLWAGLLPLSYAWSGESVEIESIRLPPDLMGRPLSLLAGEMGHYMLYDQDRELVSGWVGQPAASVVEEGRIELQVASLVGAAGTRFDVVLSSQADTIQSLLKDYRATEQGKDSGLIRVTYRGRDPERITEAVNIAIREYQLKDIQWRTAKASKTLDFLTSQLPALKVKVEKAEAALTRHKLRHNAPDLTTETTLLLQQSVTAEENLQQLRQEREGLTQKFTGNHPSMMAVNAQISQASSKKAQVDRRILTLPGSQRELATLTRDLEVNMRLFVAMLEESQQLTVAKSGTLGMVRIVDEAVVPSSPVFPRPGIVLAAALILGLVGGGFVASLLMAARDRVETVADLEDAAGPCCIAAIRHSPKQRKLLGGLKSLGSRVDMPVLALTARRDPALAGILMLRAAVLTDRVTREGGVILIGGFDAGVGRSFVLANLAVALVGASQRVVVVDADLEGRGLQRYFSSRLNGVADWLSQRSNAIDEVIDLGVEGRPDYVSAGGMFGEAFATLPPQRLRSLLVELRSRYDYVLVNAPPLSKFADGLIVAKSVDAVVVIARQFQHRASEILDITNRLARSGAPVIGTVLNQMHRSDRLGYLGAAKLA